MKYAKYAFMLILAGAVSGCGSSGGGSGGLPPHPPPTPSPGTIVEFPVPTANSGPSNVVKGPDGALWFLESNAGINKLARVTTTGAFTEFAMPAGVTFPSGLVSAPDGNLWFDDEASPAHLVKSTTAGAMQVFNTAPGELGEMAIGSDGNIWAPEYQTSFDDAFNTSGQLVHHYATGYSQQNVYIAAGTNDNLFISGYGSMLGEMTTTGTASSFNVNPPIQNGTRNLTIGPDGNLWIADENDNLIAKVNPSTGSVIASYSVPTANGSPWGITSGPDGNLWFTELMGDKIARITTSGTITEFPLPTASAQPYWIVTGPDGNLWFTESSGNKVGYIVP
ncbi:MAG TPA: hypothetical protein VKT72_03145 [Candidatus Baltobacteraceae bacterium]|nr:hypothetical protein [Candidatus Baltobacteraceae bacterium]